MSLLNSCTRMASSAAAAATSAAASAATTLESATGIGDEEEEEGIPSATDKLTIGFGEAGLVGLKGGKGVLGPPGSDQNIPWYIIDPTGEVRRSQRAKTLRNQKMGGGKTTFGARCSSRSPTLYPNWDYLTGIALIFTALVTPFEVGFLKPSTSFTDPLFIINRMIDVCFILDMCFAFFTMKKISFERACASTVPVEWETYLPILARDYFFSWFWLDVASIAPSALDFVSGDAQGASAGYRALRTVRTLRLIKLARLVKSSRIIARVMEMINISSTMQTIIFLSVRALLMTHWYACILMIWTTFAGTRMETWLATMGYCEFNEPDADPTSGEASGEPRFDPEDYHCVAVGFLYLKVFKWSLGLVFHNGFSPMRPQQGPFPPYYDEVVNPYSMPFTDGEEVVQILLKLIGIGFWSLTISSLIKTIATLGNPALIAYQQDIDSVNRFCTFNRLPAKLSREMRRYVLNTQEVHMQRQRSAIYSKISPLLVTKVTRQLNRPLFDSSFIQKALSEIPPAEGEKFVSGLVTSSTMSVFSPGDRPPSKRLYIITNGVASYRNQMLGVGDSWGDTDVLLAIPPKPSRETKAITYLRVIWIGRDDFRKLEDDFPAAFKALRAVAIFKRARTILKIWRENLMKDEAERKQLKGPKRKEDPPPPKPPPPPPAPAVVDKDQLLSEKDDEIKFLREQLALSLAARPTMSVQPALIVAEPAPKEIKVSPRSSTQPKASPRRTRVAPRESPRRTSPSRLAPDQVYQL